MTNLECPQIATQLSERHSRLLESYLLNHERGPAAIRNMIRDDIDRFNDLGAARYASELAEVLKHFEAAFLRSGSDASL